MAKHKGGEGSVSFTLTVGETETLVDLCVSSFDSLDVKKNYQKSTTTCTYDNTDNVTYTERTLTEKTLEFSFTGFSGQTLTEAQEHTLLDVESTGPVVFKRHGTAGFYCPLVTLEVSYKPGAPEGLQMFTVKGESQGKFYRGTVAPT